MRALFFFAFLCLSFSLAQAYILPTKVILQKTTDNAGSGIYAIEQEVQFPNGNEILTLKETWLIENAHTMRLTVTGTKDFQSSIRMQFVYGGGNRYDLVNGARQGHKISGDFLEKYLNFRNVDQFAAALMNLKLIPTNAFARKGNEKKGDDFKYEAEPFVRYSRTGGVVNYAFGEPTPTDKEENNPGLWIEQDQFVVRKVRLPSQVEMSADNYTQFARGLNYPRQRVVRWNNNSVNIRLISASARASSASSLFQPSSLDIPIKLEGLAAQPAKDAVIEFYSRFR